MKPDALLALVLLAVSCVNEFSWQLLPPELQGAWSYVTQYPLTLCLAILAAAGWAHSRYIVAVVAAVAVQSLPTAACSALWLLLRWPTSTGNDSCSAYLGNWALLLSGSAALIVLWRWPRHG